MVGLAGTPAGRRCGQPCLGEEVRGGLSLIARPVLRVIAYVAQLMSTGVAADAVEGRHGGSRGRGVARVSFAARFSNILSSRCRGGSFRAGPEGVELGRRCRLCGHRGQAEEG